MLVLDRIILVCVYSLIGIGVLLFGLGAMVTLSADFGFAVYDIGVSYEASRLFTMLGASVICFGTSWTFLIAKNYGWTMVMMVFGAASGICFMIEAVQNGVIG